MGLNVADAKVQHCITADQVRALNRAVLERKRARNRPPRRIPINDMTAGSFRIIINRPVVFRQVQAQEPIQYPSVSSIIDLICESMDVSRLDILSQRRQPGVVLPRQIAQAIACRLTPYSLPQIARDFGGRDHTTILHAKQKIERMRAEDSDFDATLNEFEAKLGGYNPQIKMYGPRQTWSPAMDDRLKQLIVTPKSWKSITATMNEEFRIELAQTACFGRMYTLKLRRPKPMRGLIMEAA